MATKTKPQKKKTITRPISFKQKFIAELQKSLLLDEEIKQFWINKADSLPKELLHNLIGVVKSKNDKIDEYIRAALANDPDHEILNELKSTIGKVKKEALGLEEKSQEINPEKQMEEQLKNLK